MNFLNVFCLFILAVFHEKINADKDVECLCDVEVRQRRACPAGGYLSPDECKMNNCCSASGSFSDVMAPMCFRRKESCGKDRCEVGYRKRKPCGSWQRGREYCEQQNCCYDQRMFPYCYYSRDEETNSTNNGPGLSVSDRQTRINQIENTVTPVGPNITFYDPESNSFIELQCPLTNQREACGQKTETKQSCLEKHCCWDPSNREANCYNPKRQVVASTGGLEENLSAQFDEYMDHGADNSSQMVIDTKEEIFYGNFSLIIDCHNMKMYEAGSRKLCPASNRERCLDISCCWDGTSCLEPMTRFANNTPNIRTQNGSHEIMTDPDFWRPGMIDVHEDVANKKLTCDSSMAKVHCGNPDINRTACLDKGCCWMPEFALEDKFNLVCSYPLMIDMVPVENSQMNIGNSKTFWSSWGPWSSCYVTIPFSKSGQRVRWRECFQTADYKEGMDRNEDCKLQSEESQILSCANPTFCMETFWSPWSSWSTCTNGNRERLRECFKADCLANNRLCEVVSSACDKLNETEQKPC